MLCHIPAMRWHLEILSRRRWSVGVRFSEGVQGLRMTSWHRGEVSVDCCGGVCGRTLDSHWHCGCFHTKLTKHWRLAYSAARRQPHAPQTVTTVQGRRQLQDRWTEKRQQRAQNAAS